MSKFARYLLVTIGIFCLIIYMLDQLSRDRARNVFVTIVDYRWNPIVNLTIRCHREQIQFEFEKNFTRTDLIDSIIADLNKEDLLSFSFDEYVTVRINTINRQTNETYDDDNTIDDDDISSQGVIRSDKIFNRLFSTSG